MRRVRFVDQAAPDVGVLVGLVLRVRRIRTSVRKARRTNTALNELAEPPEMPRAWEEQ